MKKIVIVGSSGAGKTTLARKLGLLLKMKVYHLDRLFWERGWKGKSKEAKKDILQCLAMNKQWIIEGSYPVSIEPALEKADAIIFLDISPLVCFKRIIKRHREYKGYPRRDIPLECTDNLTRSLIWRTLTFRWQDRKILEQQLHKYASKHIVWLRSPGEVEDFVKQVEQEAASEVAAV